MNTVVLLLAQTLNVSPETIESAGTGLTISVLLGLYFALLGSERYNEFCKRHRAYDDQKEIGDR